MIPRQISYEEALFYSQRDSFYVYFWTLTAKKEESHTLIEELSVRAQNDAKASTRSISNLFALYANHIKDRLLVGDSIDDAVASLEKTYPSPPRTNVPLDACTTL